MFPRPKPQIDPSWPLVVRKPGGISANGKHYPYGATIPEPELLDMANAAVLLSSGAVVREPPRPLRPKPQAVARSKPYVPDDPVAFCRRRYREYRDVGMRPGHRPLSSERRHHF